MLQLEKSPHSNNDPAQPKINIYIFTFQVQNYLNSFLQHFEGKGQRQTMRLLLRVGCRSPVISQQLAVTVGSQDSPRWQSP